MRARALIATAVLALAVLPGTASAALPAPSLAIDAAFAPPSGVAEDDFTSGIATDLANGTAVDGDRIYTVGEVRGATSNDIGIVARHTDGTYDTGFSGDGKLAIDVTAGERDFGVSIVVLPDHRLRVLGGTDVSTGSASSLRPVLIGLLPDGTPDPAFNGGNPVVFNAGLASSTPGAMAVAPDGRIAVAGAKQDAAGSSVSDDTFIAMRAPDGSPDPTFAPSTHGIVAFNRAGGSLNDEGVGVAFRPGGGVVALVQVATASGSDAVLDAYTDDGVPDTRFSDDGDLVLGVGDSNTQAGSIIAYHDRLWVTGATKQGSDTNAFLARVEADGSGLQSRTFDFRGRLITPDQVVVSRGSDLVVMPGVPDTLVVVGSVTPSTTTYWGAAAFNGLDGDVASMPTGDVVVPTAGPRGIVGVAAGDGWVSVAGDVQDASTSDRSFGEARLLVDADKTCDLAVKIVRPLELDVRPPAPGSLDLSITNSGTRTCGGTLSAPPAYAISHGGVTGPIATGSLAPGDTLDLPGVLVTRAGAPRARDILKLSLAAPGDVNPANNDVSIGVRFAFCDAALRPVGSPSLIPSEGAATFEFSVRNRGTVACRRVRVSPTAGGTATPTPSFAVAAGRSVTDDVRVTARPPGAVGSRQTLTFALTSSHDLNAANDGATLVVRVVGVGDSAIGGLRGGRVLLGSATRGRGHLKARQLRVSRVDVAVRRVGGCRWLAGVSGRLRTRTARTCDRPVWLRARGTRSWRLVLSRRLPAGRYLVRSRTTIGVGFREARFSGPDGNLRSFRVR